MNTYELRTVTRVKWTIECPPTTLIRDVKTMCQKYIKPEQEVSSLIHQSRKLPDDTEIGSHNINGYIIVRLSNRDPPAEVTDPDPVEIPKPIVPSQPSTVKPLPPPVQEPEPVPVQAPIQPPASERTKYPPASKEDLQLALAAISDESKCKMVIEMMQAKDSNMATLVSANMNLIKATIKARLGI